MLCLDVIFVDMNSSKKKSFQYCYKVDGVDVIFDIEDKTEKMSVRGA